MEQNIIKNQVVHADTFTLIKTIPDKFFHIAMVDPDYELNDLIKLGLLAELIRVTAGPVFIFMWPHKPWPIAKQYLFWVKPASTFKVTKSYFSMVEMIGLYGEDSIFRPGIHWQSQVNVFHDRVDYGGIHPHRKPPELLKRFIRNHVPRQSRVFDPFAGSGSCAEACNDLDMLYYGIEVEENYVRIANKRSGYELS